MSVHIVNAARHAKANLPALQKKGTTSKVFELAKVAKAAIPSRHLATPFLSKRSPLDGGGMMKSPGDLTVARLPDRSAKLSGENFDLTEWGANNPFSETTAGLVDADLVTALENWAKLGQFEARPRL